MTIEWNKDVFRSMHLGYCGETSIQTFALYHGTWLSLAAIRRAVGGELLLHRPDQKSKPKEETFHRALLHYSILYEVCLEKTTTAFLNWIKQQVMRCDGPNGRRRLVTLGVMYPGGRDPEYDHIVTVVDFHCGFFHIHDHLAPAVTLVAEADLVQPDRKTWMQHSNRNPLAVRSGRFFAYSLIAFQNVTVSAPMIVSNRSFFPTTGCWAAVEEQGKKGEWRSTDTESQRTEGTVMRVAIQTPTGGRLRRMHQWRQMNEEDEPSAKRSRVDDLVDAGKIQWMELQSKHNTHWVYV